MSKLTIPVKYIDTTKYKVRVHQEQHYFDGPDTWGNFTIVQFKDRDFNTYDNGGDYFTENGKLLPAISAKLRAGTMFTFDYYRYSNADGGHYKLNGAVTGTDDDIDGFIIFEPGYIKGVSYEERRRYAEEDLKQYTEWAQGEVYWIEILTEDGREVDSLSNVYGSDIKSCIEEMIPGAEYEAIGVHDGYQTASSEYEINI